MKRRKALLLVLSEEELLVTKERDKVCKASKRASETREQTSHRQLRTELNTSSLRQGFCTSVLFIFPVKLLYMPCTKKFR